MRACSGVWVAHGSGNADRETVDRKTTSACRRAKSRITFAASGSPRKKQQGYYYGFSNEGLWPLCHVAHARPDVPRRGLAEVPAPSTRRFADAVL